MIVVFYIVISLYAILIFRYFVAWLTAPEYVLPNNVKYPDDCISVIVAFRNEENNLKTLISCLSAQSLRPNIFEVLLVDDHSTDNGVYVAQQAIASFAHIKLLSSSGIGKKEAIAEGLKHAKGKLIVTTDADCVMESRWLEAIASFYVTHKPKLIIGPVVMRGLSGVWQAFQALEFQSLIASGAGAALAGKPIMCNGANLAYEKKLIIEDNFTLNPKYSSGDDMFLLEYVKKRYPKNISFLKCNAANVYISPEPIETFFRQRKRWVSKSGGYKDFDILYVAFLVLFSNLLLIVSLNLFLFGLFSLLIFLGLYLLKAFFDFLLIAASSNYFSTNKRLMLFVPLSLIYPFYLVYTAFSGLVSEVTWKGRSSNAA